MTDTFLFTYIVGALSVSYALMAWFRTGLALHIVDFIQGLGISHEVWDGYDEWAPATKEQLDDYLIAKLGHLPLWLELLCCPICLSLHLSYTIAIIICLFSDTSWWLVPTAVAGWPAIANIVFNTSKSN